MSIIKLNKIKKSYLDADKKLSVLNDISLDVSKGDFIAITGASGCGKSTLLHLIGLLDEPDGGELSYEGVERKSIKSMELFRNKNIGFVFQFHYLLEDFTAVENVMIPLLVQKVKKKSALEQAAKVLNELGLQDRLHHFPNQLSGGEEQRVAIARAIVTSPKIIIADEPTGNLDKDTSRVVMDIIRKLNKDGLTVIFVTHDHSLVQESDHHYILSDGILNRNVEETK